MLQTSVLNAESVSTDFAASGKMQQSSLGDKDFAALFETIQSKLTNSSFNAGLNTVGAIAQHSRAAVTDRAGLDKQDIGLDKDDGSKEDEDKNTDQAHNHERNLDLGLGQSEAAVIMDPNKMQIAPESLPKSGETLDAGKSAQSFEGLTDFEQTLTDEDLNSLKLLDQRQISSKVVESGQSSLFATDKAVLESLDGKSSKEFVNELAVKLNVEKLSLENVTEQSGVKIEAIGRQGLGASVFGEDGALSQDLSLLNNGLKLKESMLKAQINEAKFSDPNGMYNVKSSHQQSLQGLSLQSDAGKAGLMALGALMQNGDQTVKNQKQTEGLTAIKAALSDRGSQSLGSALTKTVGQSLQAQNASSTRPLMPGQASLQATQTEERFSLWTQSLAEDLDETLTASLKGTQGSSLLFAPDALGSKSALSGKGFVTTVSELQTYYAQAAAVSAPTESAMGQDAGQNMNNEAGSNQSGQLAALFAQKFALSSDGASQAAMVNEMVMSMAARNLKRMTIDLNPKVLGRMSIKLSVDDEGALHKVQIGASSDTTRSLIRNSLSTLNQLLSRQGTEVEASIDDNWSSAQA